MSDPFEVPESFIALVKTVMNSPHIENGIEAGGIEVHIGYHEVEVQDYEAYSEFTLICPYVHIVSK